MKPLCVLGVLCVLELLPRQRPGARRAAARVGGAAQGRDRQAWQSRLRDANSIASRTVRWTPAAQDRLASPKLRSTSATATSATRARADDGVQRPAYRIAMRRGWHSPNDRLRAVAYRFFRAQPRSIDGLPQLLAALDNGGRASSCVPPSCARSPPTALARARQALLREVGRGEDFFGRGHRGALAITRRRTRSTR